MWHDGRIEERGRFQCILLREEGTDESFIIVGQLHICRDAVLYESVMLHEDLSDDLRRHLYPLIDAFENAHPFITVDGECSEQDVIDLCFAHRYKGTDQCSS